MVLTPRKALDEIGGRLQKQYERWQPRVNMILCIKSYVRVCLVASPNQIPVELNR